MYDIARLVNHITGNNGQKERDLVEKLGFRNDLNRGYIRLRDLLLNGRCDPEIRGKLPRALGIDTRFVEESLKKTDIEIKKQAISMRKQLDDMEKKRFRPYIWIEHEYDKLMSGSNIESEVYERIKTIELPDTVNRLDWDEQIKIVRNAINLDQKKNKSRLFGNPINYIYYKELKESYLFDSYGGLVKTFAKPEQLKYAMAY